MAYPPVDAIRNNMVFFSHLQRPGEELPQSPHGDDANDDPYRREDKSYRGEKQMRFNNADLKQIKNGSK